MPTIIVTENERIMTVSALESWARRLESVMLQTPPHIQTGLQEVLADHKKLIAKILEAR
jgi:hypothetical protein